VEAAVPRPGETFRDCDVCPEMVVVPAGEFMMGSDNGESDERPVHKVTIHAPFAVGKFEVTFEEWEACVAARGCGTNRSPSDQGWGKGRRPVINVSWNDAKDYVGWLSRKTGKSYRLLTEAEWEYAARGGKGNLRYWWGADASHEYANYGSDACCSGVTQGRDQWVNTAPVGQFPANPFALHDMHGNVWEWVEDCYSGSYSGTPADGSAYTGPCGRRVFRGGSWLSLPRSVRSAVRSWDWVTSGGGRLNDTGFRVARSLAP
jgi:formylglycine-generating enzyme required for sulfatase activity